jgi:hypothetical protein
MGTDIHSYAEHRTHQGWRACYDPAAPRAAGPRAFFSFYCGQDRNYELFALLAGVRRLTNAGFDSIRPPRGLPADLSRVLWAVADEDAQDLCVHGHSWLTLRELLDFPWHQKQRRYEGYVDAQQYYLFQAEGRPLQMFPGPEECAAAGAADCGCQPLFGRAQIVSNRRMERQLKAGKGIQGIYTRIAFEVSYARIFAPFVEESLPLLGTLGKPQDVRIVFWFDS